MPRRHPIVAPGGGGGYGYGCSGCSERLVRFHDQVDVVFFGFVFSLAVPFRGRWSSVGGGCGAISREIPYLLLPASRFGIN